MKIVLLPGLDGTGILFKPLLDALPDNLDIVIVAYPESKLNYEELISFVTAQLPNEAFILVGESFSGNVAYHIALNKPSHLKSVIFVASFLSNPRPLLLGLFNLLPSKLLSLQPPRLIIRLFMLGFSAKSNTIQLFLETLKKLPADVLSYRLNEIAKLKLSGETSEIEATYIQASNDFLVPSKAVKDFQLLFCNLTVIKIQGPHFILQSKPDECASVLMCNNK